MTMCGFSSRNAHLQKHGLMFRVLGAEDFLSQVFYRYIQAAVSSYLQQTDVQAPFEPKKKIKMEREPITDKSKIKVKDEHLQVNNSFKVREIILLGIFFWFDVLLLHNLIHTLLQMILSGFQGSS